MNHAELAGRAFAAFALEASAVPSITLRGGNALDDHSEPPPFDPSADQVSDGYLEMYPWGIGYLDPASWRHYLPYLIEYTLRHMQHGSPLIDSLLASLRPPDREPPRLASLNAEQQAVVTRFLEALAFGDHSLYQDLACQVLEEWWIPGALYRTPAE